MAILDNYRLFETVVASLPGPISYMDRDLNYHYVNKAYSDWFGVDYEACLRSNMYEIIGEEAVRKLRPWLDAAFAGEAQDFEIFIPYKRSRPRNIHVQYIPDRNASGEVVGLVVIANDLTNERQQALAAELEESRRYLRLILDSSQHGIWGLNVEGELTFINQRALDLLGYKNEMDLVGKGMHDLVHYAFEDGSPHPKHECPMYDSFCNRKTHHVFDDVLWRKDGTSFPISYYSFPVVSNDVCVGSVVTFEDITLQKTLESSLEHERLKSLRNAKLASLGEMSAGIAHEINNPLAVLTGTFSFLADLRDQPDKFAAKIEVLKKNCARIARIVKGLEKFSRTGDKPNLHDHSINKIVQEALVLTEPRAKRQATEIVVEGESSSFIHCDDVEIEQVLVNLVNNALDAVRDLEDRWVKIHISDEGEAVVLRVRDSGPGILEDIRHRVFEPFFTTKDVGQGTGLGLSITKGILDEHKATISVLAEDRHTCFEVRFPRGETASSTSEAVSK